MQDKEYMTESEKNGKTVPGTPAEPVATDPEDEFWNMPVIRKKTYRAPTYDGRTTDTIPVSVEEDRTARTEAIPPRDPARAPVTSRPVRPADRTFRTSTYSTSQEYQNRMQAEEKRTFGFGEQDQKDAYQTFRDMDAVPKKSMAGEVICDRQEKGKGWLIRQVTVRRWINDFSFYNGFARDARISHSKQGRPADPVPFYSFVPQYAQMDDRQLAFYLWFRDNAREGRYLEADFPYILLYIFEILNLSDLIPPAEGIVHLCRMWAHYRESYKKLDTYLCEWVTDYCLIHDVPLPDCVEPFLADIVRRTQFKEFYLDSMCRGKQTLERRELEILSGVLLEAYSDYDYKKSRYYTGGSREQYDTCIPDALTAVLEDACRSGRGMFCLDRTYRLTRDSYCGAIIQIESKRRIDVAFNSCIRSPDTRRFVTGIVKYAENRLRSRLKIKSKLNAGEISAGDRALVDAYFGPEEAPLPKKKALQKAEEEAYLKLYEAETSGFDFSAAHQIEAASWANTSRLTGEEMPEMPETEYTLPEENEWLEGELSTDTADAETVPEMPESTGETKEAPTPETVIPDETAVTEEKPEDTEKVFAEVTALPAGEKRSLEKEAAAALLAGEYSQFCRDNGVFPGRMAEQINEIFLELTGDILIEADGNRYHLIEDYREDAESWSRT